MPMITDILISSIVSFCLGFIGCTVVLGLVFLVRDLIQYVRTKISD